MIKIKSVNKKLIWLMALLMLVTLTACGAEKTKDIVLEAKNADLSQSNGVILEPKDPPFNLGGWRVGQMVFWKNVEIPVSGEYTVGIDYSHEETYSNIWGSIYIYPNGSPNDGELLEFEVKPTSSEFGDWSKYKYTDTLSVFLKAGSYVVEVYPGTEKYPLPSQEYFLNLRSIKLILKEAKEAGEQKKSNSKKDGNDKKEAGELALPTGKWFKNGLKSDGNDYAEINDAGTISLFNSEGKEWHTDKMKVSIDNTQIYREITSKYISVEMDSRASALPIDGQASADLKTLVVTTRKPEGGMDIVRTKTIYLHESVANTPEAHDILQKAALIGYKWESKAGNILFCSDGVLLVWGKQFGKWEYENGVLTAIWEGEFKNDGQDFSPWNSSVKEECKVKNVEDGFTLPTVGHVTGSNIERV